MERGKYRRIALRREMTTGFRSRVLATMGCVHECIAYSSQKIMLHGATSGGQIHTLDLDSCAIIDGMSIARGLVVSRSLRVVSLSGNHMSEESAVAIANALRGSNIKLFAMRDCQLSNLVGNTFAQALPEIHTLECFRIGGNNFNNETSCAIINAARAHPVLSEYWDEWDDACLLNGL